MRTWNVLVCGTNYGRIYLSASKLRQEVYHVAGILARGSERSLETAANWQVPLYKSPEEIPNRIDLACAALGSSGSAAVLNLLKHGIPVLCEHPHSPQFVRKALEMTEHSGAHFHVNGHFADLEAPQLFSSYCVRLLEKSRPLLLRLSSSDRFLYGALDILRRSLGTLKDLEMTEVSRRDWYVRSSGSVAGIEAVFEIQPGKTSVGKTLGDGARDYLLDCSLSVVFPEGVLRLLSVAGPVVWNRTYTRTALDTVLWETLGAGGLTVKAMSDQRIRANLRAMDELRRHIEGGPRPPEQDPNHLVEVSQGWETLGQLVSS